MVHLKLDSESRVEMRRAFPRAKERGGNFCE